MRMAKMAFLAALAAAVMVSGAWTQGARATQAPAQPAGQTATQFYMDYQVAFKKATKVEDILPYMTADLRKQAEVDKAHWPEQFEMIKMMSGMYTNIKVVKETHEANGDVTLSLEAVDMDKKKATGSVPVIKEGGVWKLGKESWKS